MSYAFKHVYCISRVALFLAKKIAVTNGLTHVHERPPNLGARRLTYSKFHAEDPQF